MRIINVILVSQGIVHSIESYPIHEEQLSSEVVEQAEEQFKLECLQLKEDISDEEMNVHLENGYFDSEINYMSVNLVWSEIN
jgi:hypothetical protein